MRALVHLWNGLRPTTTASLFGVVRRDTTGAIVPQVRVNARDRSTSFARDTVTDSTGSYLITNLPVGRYAVTFEKEGFRRVVQDGVNAGGE